MAKTDSFFIRQKVETTTAGTFIQETIDLGAFVDALGRSVLRIKSISVQYADASSLIQPISVAANHVNKFAWQLTTQSQSALVYADDRAVIASGSLTLANNSSTADKLSMMDEVADLNPTDWEGGYLVGVDAIYLGVNQKAVPPEGAVAVSLVLECVSTTLTKEAAMALALSQQ